ncbi:hypothetical protein L195_g058669 [Trifolium pratense]|uniref:Uncharacterized protein n=1 Tax=Trifolium pratense TaxID=57577 RepID=A0A2K3JTM5_TRIPR|nr:hypothetical protein L195_g058669 [Trifolium pratense]
MTKNSSGGDGVVCDGGCVGLCFLGSDGGGETERFFHDTLREERRRFGALDSGRRWTAVVNRGKGKSYDAKERKRDMYFDFY